MENNFNNNKLGGARTGYKPQEAPKTRAFSLEITDKPDNRTFGQKLKDGALDTAEFVGGSAVICIGFGTALLASAKVLNVLDRKIFHVGVFYVKDSKKKEEVEEEKKDDKDFENVK